MPHKVAVVDPVCPILNELVEVLLGGCTFGNTAVAQPARLRIHVYRDVFGIVRVQLVTEHCDKRLHDLEYGYVRMPVDHILDETVDCQ